MDLNLIDTFQTFSILINDASSLVNDETVLKPEVCQTEIVKYLDFDGLKTRAGLFLMQSFILDTIINSRTRSMMMNDDMSINRYQILTLR